MEDVWIYLKKILVYFLWTLPVFLLEFDSVLGFHLESWENLKLKVGKGNRKKIARSLLLISFIIANYLVFHDAKKETREIKAERAKTLKLLETPELHGKLTSSGYRPSHDGLDTVVMVSGVVTNKFGRETALENWSMLLEFPEQKRTIHGEGIVPTEGSINEPINNSPSNSKIVIKASEYWPRKSLKSISQGGACSGWFWAVFRGIKINDLKSGNAKIVVVFEDVATGKQHYMSKEIGDHWKTPLGIKDI